MERDGIGSVLGVALRASGATALVFACAALLALVLTGPRFEASVPISFAEGPLVEPGEWIAQFQTAAFRSELGERLRDGEGWRSEPAPLAQRLRALANGDGATADEPGLGLASRLTIETDQARGALTITGEAAAAPEAQVLAKSAAEELLERMGIGSMPGSIRLGDERTAAREEVRALRARAPISAGPEIGPLVERAAALRAEQEEVRDREEAVSERLTQLRALAADPAADAPLDVSATPTLRSLIERYRALNTSIDALAQTLPDESPRLRIARLHLRAEGERIASEAAPFVAALEEEGRTLGERAQTLSGDIAVLDRTLSALRSQEEDVAAHAARLASAETRLAALASEPAATVGDAGPARAIPPPFLRVSLLAALAGAVVGAAGSAAGSFAVRRIGNAPMHRDGPEAEDAAGPVSATAGPPPIADGDEAIEVDEVVAGLSASPVSRVIVASFDEPRGPAASLRLARALAFDGQLVLLIDLSPAQAAIAEAGMPKGSIGFGDVVDGSRNLSSVIFGDEDSGADLVSIGRTGGKSSARNEFLRGARRAYDQVVVDCGTLPAKDLLSLADENTAILLASGGGGGGGGGAPALAERLREFRDAGLEIAILAA